MGVKIPFAFSTGRGSAGQNHAQLVVTSRLIQDALESDPRFNKVYRLVATYGSTEQAANETQARVVGHAPARRRTAAEIRAEQEAEADAIKAEAEATQKPKRKTTKKIEAVEFDSINDAIAFLEEKGEVVDDENINTLLEKYNAKIK